MLANIYVFKVIIHIIFFNIGMIFLAAIGKKLDAAGKRKDCGILHKWIKAIKAHLYWSVRTSGNT